MQAIKVHTRKLSNSQSYTDVMWVEFKITLLQNQRFNRQTFINIWLNPNAIRKEIENEEFHNLTQKKHIIYSNTNFDYMVQNDIDDPSNNE